MPSIPLTMFRTWSPNSSSRTRSSPRMETSTGLPVGPAAELSRLMVISAPGTSARARRNVSAASLVETARSSKGFSLTWSEASSVFPMPSMASSPEPTVAKMVSTTFISCLTRFSTFSATLWVSASLVPTGIFIFTVISPWSISGMNSVPIKDVAAMLKTSATTTKPTTFLRLPKAHLRSLP
ncbi:MAG: hypothetical protein BWY80_01169 [Firmicutes bacterium ADurb.Bin456]|nr:MAG: hypothetical protein BWY80_01169 [Firmicutes bacterium ADurb.Bin456]